MKVVKYTLAQLRQKRKPVYWIEEIPIGWSPTDRCGPYDDRQQAISDRDGMQIVMDHRCTPNCPDMSVPSSPIRSHVCQTPSCPCGRYHV